MISTFSRRNMDFFYHPLVSLLIWMAVISTTLGAGITSSPAPDIVASMQSFPEASRGALDTMMAASITPSAHFCPDTTQPLIDFVRKACVMDSGWELPKLDGASGSAFVMKVKVPLQQYLALNFHPQIPDYAVFPAALRYSGYLNHGEMQQAYTIIGSAPTGTTRFVTARMTGIEEITPNPESGSYFSYTNSRVFFRCKVAQRDVLFSYSKTLGPSTFSNRGVPVGPLEQALF